MHYDEKGILFKHINGSLSATNWSGPMMQQSIPSTGDSLTCRQKMPRLDNLNVEQPSVAKNSALILQGLRKQHMTKNQSQPVNQLLMTASFWNNLSTCIRQQQHQQHIYENHHSSNFSQVNHSELFNHAQSTPKVPHHSMESVSGASRGFSNVIQTSTGLLMKDDHPCVSNTSRELASMDTIGSSEIIQCPMCCVTVQPADLEPHLRYELEKLVDYRWMNSSLPSTEYSAVNENSKRINPSQLKSVDYNVSERRYRDFLKIKSRRFTRNEQLKHYQLAIGTHQMDPGVHRTESYAHR